MAFECLSVEIDTRNYRRCSIEGCLNAYQARGWCGTHWLRWRKHGDPTVTKSIKLDTACAIGGCHGEPSARHDGVTYCNRHWQRIYKTGRADLPGKSEEPWRRCIAEGCTKAARSRRGLLCEMHYGRRRRNGHDGVRRTRDGDGRRITVDGYVNVRASGHPLARRTGYTYEHRVVLYDAIGPGEHPCHWCKSPVRWEVRRGPEKLVVDHIDGDKQRNDRENLAPSCHACNSRRGLFMRWVMDHRDDPFLWALFRKSQMA